jgi:X-Pro dipeptidyl-peptidase
VAPDGTTKTVSRGFLNLLYRDGLAAANDIPAGERIRATVTFKPQDQTLEAGHSIGVNPPFRQAWLNAGAPALVARRAGSCR